jgi:hypothetical protein
VWIIRRDHSGGPMPIRRYGVQARVDADGGTLESAVPHTHMHTAMALWGRARAPAGRSGSQRSNGRMHGEMALSGNDRLCLVLVSSRLVSPKPGHGRAVLRSSGMALYHECRLYRVVPWISSPSLPAMLVPVPVPSPP